MAKSYDTKHHLWWCTRYAWAKLSTSFGKANNKMSKAPGPRHPTATKRPPKTTRLPSCMSAEDAMLLIWRSLDNTKYEIPASTSHEIPGFACDGWHSKIQRQAAGNVASATSVANKGTVTDRDTPESRIPLLKWNTPTRPRKKIKGALMCCCVNRSLCQLHQGKAALSPQRVQTCPDAVSEAKSLLSQTPVYSNWE